MRHLPCLLGLIAFGAGCATADGITSSGDNCSPRTCPNGGRTYQFCVSQTFTDCHYRFSDGSVFVCTSCGDCAGGSAEVTRQCGGPVDAGARREDLRSAPVGPAADGGVGTDPGEEPEQGGGGGGGGDPCDTCVEAAESGACAGPADACFNDPGCSQLLDCLIACPAGNDPCYDGCFNQAPPKALAALDALDGCICSSCSNQCMGCN